MRRATPKLWWAMAMAMALATRAAGAQSPADLEQAKTYFNAGAQAFAAGQFEAATQAFEQSYQLAPRPAILFSMAQAERRQFYLDKRPDTLRRAVAHYRKYLEADAKGNRRGDAAQALAELEPQLGKVEGQPAATPLPAVEAQTRVMVSSPTRGVEIALDGTKGTELPLIAEVKPGKHLVRVTAPGYFDEDREVTAVKGGLMALDVALRERPAVVSFWVPDGAEVAVDGRPQGAAPLPAMELPAGRHLVAVTLAGHRPYTEELDLGRGERRTLKTGLAVTGQRVASYWVLGAGGVAVVAGGVLAGLSLHKQSAAQGVLDEKGKGNVAPARLDDYAADRDARDRYRTASIATLSGGLALGALGALLYAFDRPVVSATRRDDRARPPEPVEVAPAPLLGQGLIGGALSGRF